MKNKVELKYFKNYWFILSVFILILNDIYLKKAFGNLITGKLSDIFGLFAFSWFCMIFFQKRHKDVLLIISIVFIWWKSPLSDNFINLINSNQYFNISRVVDYSDLLALFVIPFVAFIFKKRFTQKLIKIPVFLPIGIAIFSFLATSYSKKIDYGTSYEFSITKQQLIDDLNSITKSDTTNFNLPLSSNYQNSNYCEPYNNDDSLLFYVSSYREYIDTIFKQNSKEISSINKYKIPNKDSMYLSSKGYFEYSINVRKYFEEVNSNYCDKLTCQLKITENQNGVSLKLISINTHNCMGMFDNKTKKIEKDKLLHSFEKEVIEKIRNQSK